MAKVIDNRTKTEGVDVGERRLRVLIEGICPMLHAKIYTDPVGTKRGQDKESEEYKDHMFENSSYKDDKGWYNPISHFEGCLIRAGAKMKVGKQSYKPLMKTGVILGPEKVYIGGGFKVERYDRYIRRTDGQLILKSSPMITNWQMAIDCLVNDERINLDAFKQVWAIAGHDIGISSYIPKYGRFRVVGFEKI